MSNLTNLANTIVSNVSVLEKVQARALKARTDFYTYVSMMTDWKIAKHQKAWIEELQKVADGQTKELLLVGPPGSSKSTLVSVLFGSWMIGRSPDGHGGILSYGDKPAHERVVAVRRIIEFHPVFHLIFPDVQPNKDESWSRKSFTVKRKDIADPHPSLMGAGSSGTVISYRLSWLIYDDPHDEKNTKTAYKRRQVLNTYDETITTRLIEGAPVICVATRWAEDDLPGSLQKRGFHMIHQKAIVETVTKVTKDHPRGSRPTHIYRSYWPEKYSLAFLQEKERRNPEVFYLQYQGDIKGGKSAVIKRIHTYTEAELPPRATLMVAGGGDTAYKSTETNDFNVIYIGGLDSEGNIWILDRFKDRCGVNDLADEVIRLRARWNYYTLWLEDTGQATPAVEVVRRKTIGVPIELTKPGQGGKHSKAAAIAAYLNTGQVKFPVSADWLEDAEYYLLHFGHAEFDDDVDALFYLVFNLLQAVHFSKYGIGRPKKHVRFALR